MAGILDDVMDGIAAKEKQGMQPTIPPASVTPPTTPPVQGQTPQATTEVKPMHNYSDQFKGKYGERKPA